MSRDEGYGQEYLTEIYHMNVDRIFLRLCI